MKPKLAPNVAAMAKMMPAEPITFPTESISGTTMLAEAVLQLVSLIITATRATAFVSGDANRRSAQPDMHG
jgi:hypothetical protein